MSEKKDKTRDLLLELSCFLSLAISVIPVVDYYSPWITTMIPVLFILAITLGKKDNIMPAITLVMGAVLLGLWQFAFINRSAAFTNYLLNFVITFLPCLVAYQIRSTYDRPRFYKNYLQTLAVFTGITSITTIIGLEKYPMAARELASGTAIYDTDHYRAENIGGYEYIYALVILIPLLVYLIKHTQGWIKALNIVILIVNILCVYESQYTTALILVGVAFLLLLAFRSKLAFTVTVFMLLLFWLFGGTELLSNFFRYLSENVGQEYVADRFLQLSQLFGGGEIHTETSTDRIDYYQRQIELFFESPVWGQNLFAFSSDNISGHSFVLDWLGSLGLLGFGVVTFFVRKLYLNVVRFSRKKTSATVKLTWLMLIILSVLNPVIFPLITTIAFTACSFLEGYEESILVPLEENTEKE